MYIRGGRGVGSKIGGDDDSGYIKTMSIKFVLIEVCFGRRLFPPQPPSLKSSTHRPIYVLLGNLGFFFSLWWISFALYSAFGELLGGGSEFGSSHRKKP